MAMYPPELESTKHDGPPAPRPDIYDMFPKLGRRPSWKIFWHAFLAFSLAFSVCVYVSGGSAQGYVVAVICAMVLGVPWARVAAAPAAIYGIAGLLAAIAAFVGWIRAG